MTTQTWTAKATGRSATTEVVELFAFEDGLIVGIRVFPQDTHRLLATLAPGDLIGTGTPGGVGEGRMPPVYLKAGDTSVCTIDKIGSLTNPVQAFRATATE